MELVGVPSECAVCVSSFPFPPSPRGSGSHVPWYCPPPALLPRIVWVGVFVDVIVCRLRVWVGVFVDVIVCRLRGVSGPGHSSSAARHAQ